VVCKQVVRCLCEFLDGELSPDLAEELERHLVRCEDCKIVVDTTRKTVEVYCNTEPLPLPDEVQERLERALAEKLGRTEA
jgi:anti-sigma factor RsiW